MAIETRDFDVANYLTDSAEIAEYLEAEFEEYEQKYMVLGLEAVIRARGGVARVAAETGVAEERLSKLSELDDSGVRETAMKVMEAFRPLENEASKVA